MKEFFKEIIWLKEVTSTQDYIKKLALEGAESGTIAVAAVQTVARGRFEKSWRAPLGGLYFSFLLRPDKVEASYLGWLPLVWGLAASKFVEKFSGVEAKLKWPNDVYVNDKKLAGILCESQFLGDKLDFVVSGMGINIDADADSLPENAVNLRHLIDDEIDIKAFLNLFLPYIYHYYDEYMRHGSKYIKNEISKIDYLAKKKVIVNSQGEILLGIADGVDDNGRLILDSPEVGRLSFSSAEISLAV
ncbi:MAG: biotin--[acetyl-CoA-carboxylase] ligase [Candidatus Omnitrophica bacterium]|nr:biotin--[acetyl-CoA-carboxylase] ligase [Candidatus Omnitrophota bacterium]MDD5081653.1 biotin--[acetyl-CoA-carboxylase] ligase [Candidatus Omnitrophota bacterium]MDD5441367.1 biotin--[acetyl-CoA-carboxylase] ligase [Candidatus Omnitrophota bacterium]